MSTPAKKAAKKAASKTPAKSVIKKKAVIVKAPAATKAPFGVCAELLKVAGITFDPKQEVLALSEAICEKITEMADADFQKLSQPAQTWFNQTADFLNKKPEGPKELPALPGYPGATTAAAAKPAKGDAAGKPKAAKPAKEATGNKRGALRADSVVYKMRQAVIDGGPDLSFEDACKAAGTKGAERGGHEWNGYFNTRQVIRQLVEQGKLKYPKAAAAAA